MINLDKPSLLVKGNLEDIKKYLHTLVDSLQYALEDNEGMIFECREKLANFEDGNNNIKVEATNIEGEINADQINADGLEMLEGTIGDWTLGVADVPISEGTTTPANALFSGVQRYDLDDGQWYTTETWLTAGGVYCRYTHYTEGEEPQVTCYSKKWWELLKD